MKRNVRLAKIFFYANAFAGMMYFLKNVMVALSGERGFYTPLS
jgi:hypothetical protein